MGRFRISIDVGGTFTDVVVVDGDGDLSMHKAATTPAAPVEGILRGLRAAAIAKSLDLRQFLAATDLVVHAGTAALNAVVSGTNARTGFLTTEGHPDVLLLREGGRSEPFNYTIPFPDPMVPRRFTYAVRERILSDGRVLKPLDRDHLARITDRLVDDGIEAVGVALIWSIVNPAHEIAVGAFLAERVPGLEITLSHQLNPIMREYRRASSACLDASLKPVMARYLNGIDELLRSEGYGGTVLAVTSRGTVLPLSEVVRAPIHALNSGPASAPVAGGALAEAVTGCDTAIVVDAGGTTFDVSVVRKRELPLTQEHWIGGRYRGHITGFPSIDIRSVGAGGGSIAWIDDGGLLRVGPGSAGADPGPACYRRGGVDPTLTDAAVALGYIAPDLFLGGEVPLDADLARTALSRISGPLDLTVEDAALAVLQVASESMAQAAEEVTVRNGIDPTTAVLVAGGGASGLVAVGLGTRLGCRTVVIPAIGPTMSAAGALIADILHEHRYTGMTRLDHIDAETLETVARELANQAERSAGDMLGLRSCTYFINARYARQAWDIEVDLGDRLPGLADLATMRGQFDEAHARIHGVADPGSHVEILSWGVRVRETTNADSPLRLGSSVPGPVMSFEPWRRAYFPEIGWAEVPVVDQTTLDREMVGPLIAQARYTAVIIGSGALVRQTPHGLLITPPASKPERAPGRAAA